MPSQQHQVMSQNTVFGGVNNQGRPDSGNQTNTTDQNLQENFKQDSANQAFPSHHIVSQGHYQQQRTHHQQNSSVPTLQYQHSQYTNNQRDLVNNTNDLNPMIMMSGEDGSASPTG
tara:strand:+ start:82 stop:429 length:348 start_codon:yes stop_codon:yes gene_type:complete